MFSGGTKRDQWHEMGLEVFSLPMNLFTISIQKEIFKSRLKSYPRK